MIEADCARAGSVPAPRSARLIQPGAAAVVITAHENDFIMAAKIDRIFARTATG